VRIPQVTVFALLLVASMIFISYSGSAFASHYDQDEIPLEDDREWLRYYMIFASHEKQCSNFDESRESFLRSVTNQVLREYNFQTTSRMECVEVSGNMEYDGGNTSNTFGVTLDNALKRAKDWHFDLLIVIFDEELSQQYYREMRESGRPAAGHARYYGDYKNIVITTSPPPQYSEFITDHLPPLRNLQEIEEERGAWILSHELAHFTLEYLGYPRADSVDYVHDTQKEYDTCQYFGFRQDFCSELYFEIKRLDDRANEFWIKVMDPPYEDIKRWRDLPTKTYEYTTVPISISINTSRTATEVGDKMWINGKVTTPIYDDPVYLKIFDPYGKVVLEEKLRVNKFSEYRFSFISDSSLMPYAGTYTVKVNYRANVQIDYFTHSIPSKIVESTPVTPQPITPTPQPSFSPTTTESLIAANFRMVDPQKNMVVSNSLVDVQVNPVIDLTNPNSKEQPFAYVIKIHDSNGIRVSIAWITGSLSPGQSFSPSLSWIPTDPGIYTVTGEGWKSTEDKTPLFTPQSFTFEVLPERVSSYPSQPIQPKQESTKVYPVSPSDLDSDDGVTYDSAHSKQVNQWAKFNKIQAKITELRSIYDSQSNNPNAQQKLDRTISKLEKFESDLQILKDVLVVGDGFMDRGKYSKASTVYIRTIHGLNNLGFTELQNIESAVNGARNIDEVFHQSESESSWADIPTGLVNTKNVELEPEPTCSAGTELVNGICQVVTTDEPESKSSWFDNIPTGLVDTKNVKPGKTCFLWWCW